VNALQDREGAIRAGGHHQEACVVLLNKSGESGNLTPQIGANLQLLKISTIRRSSTADASDSSSGSSRQDQRWFGIRHRDTIKRM
jgi:hypothetical protein